MKITGDGSKEFFSFLSFGLLGEQTTSFKYKLKAGEIKEIKFEDMGIAKAAKIIRFNQTRTMSDEDEQAQIESGAKDNFFTASVLQPNKFSAETFGSSICLVGVPFQPPVATETPISATVQVMVSWLPPESIDEFYPLVSALQAYYRDALPEAVVAASASVERALFSTCDLALHGVVGKKKRKNFLENQCTFSGQIDILSKIICDWKFNGVLPERFAGPLNRLRSLRNDVAHYGEFRDEVSAKEVYELICIAIFGTHLFRAMTSVLLDEPSKPQPPTPAASSLGDKAK
ncbi:hypothetical protein [uncultured Ruegeria sp.]|uniref:hypothetical protein n=1 Tax=uncultured Ruegeria sp. TaxID=259304 RepID=UPI002633069E|nr:hypothetical protein [uncultured Ruegeria sp.]